MSLLENVLHGLGGNTTELLSNPKTSVKPYSKQIQSNVAIANEITQRLAKNLHVTKPVTCSMREGRIFDLIAGAGSSTIFLPPLYFIDRKQIPFTGPDDPTINDNKKLQAFADQLSKEVGRPNQKINFVDRMSLRIYLKTMENPAKAQKAFQFMLAHELGHIHHSHGQKHREALEKKSVFFKLMNKLTNHFLGNIIHRKLEMEADAFAYQSSKDFAEGGIYLFSVFKNPGLK